MKRMILATLALAMLGHAVTMAGAQAQNLAPKAGNAPADRSATSSNAGAVPAAPVGHRQPTRGDAPVESGSNNPANIDAQDRQLDRMIKGICKGC